MYIYIYTHKALFVKNIYRYISDPFITHTHTHTSKDISRQTFTHTERKNDCK